MGKLLEEMKLQNINRTRLSALQNEMKPEEYADLLVALKDENISASAISRALGKRNYTVSVSVLTHIRRSMK